jgi:hypothetical protein
MRLSCFKNVVGLCRGSRNNAVKRRWVLIRNSRRCGIGYVEHDYFRCWSLFTPGLASATKSVVVDYATRRIEYEPLGEGQQV